MKTNSAFFKVSIVHLSAVIIVLALFSSWLFLSAKTEVNKANSSNSEEEKMNTKFKESKTADEKSKDHPYKILHPNSVMICLQILITRRLTLMLLRYHGKIWDHMVIFMTEITSNLRIQEGLLI